MPAPVWVSKPFLPAEARKRGGAGSWRQNVSGHAFHAQALAQTPTLAHAAGERSAPARMRSLAGVGPPAHAERAILAACAVGQEPDISTEAEAARSARGARQRVRSWR